MANRLFSIFILVLISLIPAILLYLLFGQLNSAGVQWSRAEAVQLGGPIAGFAATLLLLWWIYDRMRATDNPLETLLEPFEGKWTIESKSAGSSGRKARSETTMALEKSELRIVGGTFFDVAADGSQGAAIGDWQVEMAASDGQRLKYFYVLTDSVAESTWRGLVEVRLQPGLEPPTLRGTWQVIGTQVHSGDILLTKSGK